MMYRSGSTFISEYSDASVFKEASKDPGINTIQERTMNYFPENPESIPTLWLNALERDMPVDPSTLPVYQPALTNSNRAPASSTELSLPSTPVSPLVPILEEVEEEEKGEADVREDRGEQDGEEGRPMSWISSGANSVHTESSAQLSQSRSSRSRSIKRKPVPIT